MDGPNEFRAVSFRNNCSRFHSTVRGRKAERGLDVRHSKHASLSLAGFDLFLFRLPCAQNPHNCDRYEEKRALGETDHPYRYRHVLEFNRIQKNEVGDVHPSLSLVNTVKETRTDSAFNAYNVGSDDVMSLTHLLRRENATRTEHPS